MPHRVPWRYITVTLVTCTLISTMASTNHTFRTAEGNVTFAVYQGQECPQENVGKPGDVSGGGSSVFVKTTEGWKLYLMHSEHLKRIRHPKHPQRVLSLNDGQFVWTALSTFRVRRWRTADKDVKGQADNLPITIHDVKPTSDS